MRTPIYLAALFALPAFAAKPAPAPVAPEVEATAPGFVARAMPEALPERPFVMPEVQRGTLSNGVEVLVVSNHEVPLWNARVVFRTGPDFDPEGLEGLVDVTFDMMDEGVRGRDAEALAKAAKRLGGGVGAGAGRDAAAVSVWGPTKSLNGLMNLFADVLLRPTFPKKDWSLKQTQRIANLQASMEDPNAIASRVFNKVVWGDGYAGRLNTEAAYAAIRTSDMKKLYKQLVRPDQAVILVGGDITLDRILPELEARLGNWKPGRTVPTPAPAAPNTFGEEVVYVVDKPGTAQATLRAALPVIDRQQAGYMDLFLANTAVGGAFTARVNMNLREDKGWTYGARCGISDSTGPSVFVCSTGVQIDQTVPSLLELRREIVEATADRPVTDDELAYFSSYRVNSFYGAYETPNALLGELQDIWTYRLPGDWLERYVPALQAVTTASANDAFRKHIDTSRIAWFIIGDVATFGDALEATGLRIVKLDRDGNPIPE